MAGINVRYRTKQILSDVRDERRCGIVATNFIRVLAVAFMSVMLSGCSGLTLLQPAEVQENPPVSALTALESLPIKGHAPKTGYSRSEFGKPWTDTSAAEWADNGLSAREDVLSRDLPSIVCKAPPRAKAAPTA